MTSVNHFLLSLFFQINDFRSYFNITHFLSYDPIYNKFSSKYLLQGERGLQSGFHTYIICVHAKAASV